ncbi:Cas4 family exonuclease [Erwinia phage AH03]|uniref:Cas4 family exonuclease n=1 Tax=Erwinia phage AH03 TaxID=2869568 RepID=A0AAE8BUJ4_9CAUD|nr:Cas4 family exonuclease [Erwinia phage AH03]
MQNTENQSSEDSLVKLSLSDKGVKRALAKKIKEDVDAFCADYYDDGFRTHLGCSSIGKECSRDLWYSFRWIAREKFDGRRLRLFQRGHREEEHVIKYLEGIGCTVWAFDPNTDAELPKEKRQIKVSAHYGHFGGSVDAVVKLPERYGIDEPVLCSIKTSGTGALFTGYTTKGLQQHKPVYMAQESAYGALMDIRFALFFVANKNDDDIYIEIVELSKDIGTAMLGKAEQVIFSDKAPPRISENPTFLACTYCDKKGVCHMGEKAEMNCRSCKHSKPVENKEWYCAKHNGNIPKEFIAKGCDHWISIIVED